MGGLISIRQVPDLLAFSLIRLLFCDDDDDDDGDSDDDYGGDGGGDG